MFKFIILSFALILLTAAQPWTSVEDDITLEVPIFNDTDLENPSYRFAPFFLKDKIYAVNAFVKVNWFVAQQICSYQGMTLASINSAIESERLKYELIANDLISYNDTFWISGNDLGSQDHWIWFSNGVPIAFQNWAAGQPNNYDGNERCLQLLPDGKWNDLCCDTSMYFICENRCALGNSVPLF